MSDSPQHAVGRESRRPWRVFAGVSAVAVVAVGAGFIATASGAHPPAKSKVAAPPAVPVSVAPPTTVAPGPLRVEAVAPARGQVGVSGATTIRITTVATVATVASSTPVWPVLRPAIPGRWTSSGQSLVFTPDGAWPPATTVTVTLPAGSVTTASATLEGASSWSFTTRAGSTLRLQQLLAYLGYLPVNWHPTVAGGSPTGVPDAALAEKAVYQPPAGTFGWRWASTPTALRASWSRGANTVVVKGAVMAFQADRGLTTDGVAGPQVWAALLASSAPGHAPRRNANGYTYALASKVLPESLTVWHNGTLVNETPANTGIPVAPTVDGTFPVYERLATQIMRGSNPDGSKYADPVAWVAYFNGGDAIHYIGRGWYGSPQSLGCVEIPYGVGQLIWPHLTLGTLVTVTG